MPNCFQRTLPLLLPARLKKVILKKSEKFKFVHQINLGQSSSKMKNYDGSSS